MKTIEEVMEELAIETNDLDIVEESDEIIMIGDDDE